MNIYYKSLKKCFLFNIIVFCFVISISAQNVPSDLMSNCKQWKITYPTGDEDKTLCGEPNNEYFFVNTTKDAIVFKTPIRTDSGTTSNSSYIRSELRERVIDGSKDIYWTTEGTHLVYVKQAITHLPINKPHLVATQIHGNKDNGIDDSMVLRLENSHLFLSFNGSKLRSNVTIKRDYTLGTIHEVIFIINNGKHYCYYAEDGKLLSAFNSNIADSYLIKDGDNDFLMDLNYDQTYFKIGNYTQSNPDKEGNDTNDPENYGEVLVYDFAVSHGDVNVTDVNLSPETVDLLVGKTKQLTAEVIPASASNINVNFNSSNVNVATVDAYGLVTAISEGKATITVETEDGGLTDTSEINVFKAVTSSNLALNKSIVGTGTTDGANVVSNLVDGSVTTRWSVSGFPQNTVIDLGAVYNLNRTEMICYKDRDYQYTVSVSKTENGTYTQVVDRSENTTPGTEVTPIIDTFTTTGGRFVKINVTGANSYTGTWVSLIEFKLFGEETLSINDEDYLSKKVVIWPNPVKDYIQFNSPIAFISLQVYVYLGKEIINQTIKENLLNVSGLKPGIYFVKFIDNEKSVVKKFVKE